MSLNKIIINLWLADVAVNAVLKRWQKSRLRGLLKRKNKMKTFGVSHGSSFYDFVYK